MALNLNCTAAFHLIQLARPFLEAAAEDILGALTYLLSDEASYVSGAHIMVTGAWNLG